MILKKQTFFSLSIFYPTVSFNAILMDAAARLTGNMLRKKSKTLPMTIGAIIPDTTFFLPKYKNITPPKQKLTTILTNGISATKSKMAATINIGQYLPNLFPKDNIALGFFAITALATSLAKPAAFLA